MAGQEGVMTSRIRHRFFALCACLLALPFIWGGFCFPDPDPDPCELDPFRCQDPGVFEYDDSCELTGELQVEVGHGETRFETFDTVPEQHFGGQGGSHIFVAVRVLNAALDRYDKLLVKLDLTTPITGCESDGGDVGSNTCTYLRATRTVTLGQNGAIRTNSTGAVEEVGIILFDAGSYDEPNTLTATVEDPCRRAGTDTGVFVR